MSDTLIYPADETELRELVLAQPRLQIVGGETKTALVQPIVGTTRVSMLKLDRVIDHQPSEFLVTVQAGARLQQLAAVLADHGQYLPFDPPLSDCGATVGGTVAAGLSGPGRLRHGGIRDFVVGIRFIDGLGNAVTGGGKVVKNSAGYDFPKLFVGSCGQLGAITEVTFKVFPKPIAARTLRIECKSLAHAVKLQDLLAKLPIEWSAIDLVAPVQLVVRYEGNQDYLEAATDRITKLSRSSEAAHTIQIENDDKQFWLPFQDGSLVSSEESLVRVPLVPSQLMTFDQTVASLTTARRYSVAGNVAWLNVADDCQWASLDDCLLRLGLGGTVLLRTPNASVLKQVHLGKRPSASMLGRVKSALDPQDRFGSHLQ